MNTDLKKLQEVIGYDFKDEKLLRKALIHPSYSGEAGLKRYESNQRLEFLGDAVLELIVSEYLYFEHPTVEEGELTRKRSSLVFEDALAISAKAIGLGDFIYLGKGEDASKGRKKPSILSDAFESVIGALYIDGGYDAAKDFIFKFVIGRVKEMSLLKDGKSVIQKFVQSRREQKLEYRVTEIAEAGDPNRFEAGLYIDDELIATGTGQSKKAAEQCAAVRACGILNLV